MGANYGLPHILIGVIINLSNALSGLGREIKNPCAKDSELQCIKRSPLLSILSHARLPQIRSINLCSETNVGKAPHSFSPHYPVPRLGIN